MSSLVVPTNVRFDQTRFWVELSDGRALGIPIAWFPVLEAATDAQRLAFELSTSGISWDEIDEDISVQGLLDGVGDVTNRGKRLRAEAAKRAHPNAAE
jgi:hypothetical protein